MIKKTVAALLFALFFVLTSSNPVVGARPNADTEREAAVADYMRETSDTPIKGRERSNAYDEKTSKESSLIDNSTARENADKISQSETGEEPTPTPNPTPMPIPTPEPKPPTFLEEYGAYIITAEVVLILAAFGMMLVIKTSLSQDVEKLKTRLENIEDRLSPDEDSMKNNSHNRDSSTEISALMKRLDALEVDRPTGFQSFLASLEERISVLERKIPTLGNEHNEYASAQTDTHHRMTNTVTNANTTVQNVFAEKKSTLPSSNTISSGDKLKQIADEFNAMVTRASNAGMGVVDVKREFVQKYGVIAFKCVNYHERMSDSGLPPQFAVDEPLAGKNLWGIPINNEYLAVVPNMPDYEKNAHFKGGMKELFNPEYSDGRYKIKVKRPAIVKRNNFEIKFLGELELY